MHSGFADTHRIWLHNATPCTNTRIHVRNVAALTVTSGTHSLICDTFILSQHASSLRYLICPCLECVHPQAATAAKRFASTRRSRTAPARLRRDTPRAEETEKNTENCLPEVDKSGSEQQHYGPIFIRFFVLLCTMELCEKVIYETNMNC